MKKVLFCALASLIMGATLVSCDNDKEKCYEVKFRVTTNVVGVENKTEVSSYIWTSANDLNAAIDEMKKEIERANAILGDAGSVDVKVLNKKVAKYASEEDCLAANANK